ncbi:hypothetical protein EBZ35_03165 [bacterium]|nr:hypothetical protein [bacterium]
MYPIKPRAVLTDAHGVIYNESGPIPSAIAQLNHWASEGIPIWVVTNNTTASPPQIAAHLCRMGVPVSPGCIVSSGHGLALDPTCQSWVKGRRVYTYGYPDSIWYVQHAGGCPVDHPDGAEVIVVAASTGDDNDADYQRVYESLARDPQRPVVAINPDRWVSAGNGVLVKVAGYYAQQLAETLPISVHWMGKPMPLFSDVVRRLVPLDWDDQVVFYDDNPRNVVQLATDLGVTGIGVRDTGLVSGQSDDDIVALYGVIPTHWVRRLGT